MVTIKSFTDFEQSKKLAEILPLESADITVIGKDNIIVTPYLDAKKSLLACTVKEDSLHPCWSLVALLKYLSDIKPQEYTFTLTINEGKWCFGLMEYGLGYIRDEFNDNPVDACYEMILKLNEFNLL